MTLEAVSAPTTPASTLDSDRAEMSTEHTAVVDLTIRLGFPGCDWDSDAIPVQVTFTYWPGSPADPARGDVGAGPEVEVLAARAVNDTDYDDGICPWTGEDLSILGRVNNAIHNDEGDMYEQLVRAARRARGELWSQRFEQLVLAAERGEPLP